MGYWNCPCVPMRERKVSRPNRGTLSWGQHSTRQAFKSISFHAEAEVTELIRDISPGLALRLGLAGVAAAAEASFPSKHNRC
jgi:hypothetical protein